MALLVITAFTFTAAYSFDVSAASFGELLLGSFANVNPLTKQAEKQSSARNVRSAAQPAPATTSTNLVTENSSGDEIATVTTDRTDYNPGETVVITGSGFTVFEPVTLNIDREGVQVATYTANADENGNFINRQFVIGADDVGATFVVKATGATSGKTAQSVFTDGTITYSPGSQNFTGGSAVTSGASAVTVSFNQTVILPDTCGVSFSTNVLSVPNSITFGGNPTTPFPAGFVVSAPALNFGAGGGAGNLSKLWLVGIQVPANTTPGFYSTQVRVSNPQCHTAGIGTQVVVEVKAPTPTDTTAPTTTVISGTYINNTWTNQNVTVNLSSVDNSGGVGMKSLTYSVTSPGSAIPVTTNVLAAPFTASIPVTAEGNTTIQFFARDNLDNTEATQTFYVNIDKTAPSLTLPNDITIQADDANGKVVNFTATATDRSPASQTATCTPASGSLFAIGTTPVNCSATDDVGNTSNGSFNVNVTPAAQTIDFAPLGDKVYGDADFNVSAIASSGLAVSFAAAGDCTVTGTTVHITGAGSCTITASQAGNASYNAAPNVQQSFNIAKAATTTVVTCPATVTYTGAALEPCSASVTGAGGLNQSVTVVYSNNTDAGTASASATYTETANYFGSNDSKNFTIGKASTTTTLTCPTNVTYTGSAIEPCTATVTGANLNQSVAVTYINNVGAGTATANASYAESANHLASSDSENFTIDKASTVTTVTCPANVTYTGLALEPCTASVTGPALNQSLTVTYNNNVNAGTATASASYGESANYLASSDSKYFTIDKANSTTAVTCPVSVVYNGTAQVPCTVSVTGAGNLHLTPDASYANNVVAGTATASYNFAGDANHIGSSDSETFEITKAPVTATAGSGTHVYDGATHSPAACAVTGAYTGDLVCTNSPATVGPDAGTMTIVPQTTGTELSNFVVTSVSGSYTISKAPTTTTVTFEAGPYVYRGSAFTASANVTGAANLNSPVSVSYSGNCTNVTVANGCTATATYAESANYQTSTDSESITITPRSATWTTNNNGKIFGSSDPSPLTTGSGSGFLPADGVTATYSRVPGELVGTYQITATLSPASVLVNYGITNNGATFTIGAWTLNGFYQPVGIPNTYASPSPTNFVWNTVKGGQTVPLKFNVFAGAVEQTSTGIISFYYSEIPCTSSGTGNEDPIEITTTGGTTLRYSGTPGVDGQYIQNWQTPNAPNKCYRLQMRTADGSSLFAFFKLKK